MGVLSHAALEGLASDPRSGVVAVHKSVQLIIDSNDIKESIKELIVKKLNSNMNKYYPDAGGFLMGYHDIKLLRSSSEVITLQPVHARAKFYLFRPQVGSELQCEVTRKEVGLVTCVAHGVFEVELVNPPQCWQAVFTGQTINVKVDAVEQLAWQQPRIVASLLEVGGDSIPPCIDIVDNLEADEVECVTDSANNNAVSREQVDSSAPAKKRSKKTSVPSNLIAAAGRKKLIVSLPFSRLNSKSNSMGPPTATSSGQVEFSPGKKSVSKSLPKMLPKPTKSKCVDTDHDEAASNDKDDDAMNKPDSQAPVVTPVKSSKVTQAPKTPSATGRQEFIPLGRRTNSPRTRTRPVERGTCPLCDRVFDDLVLLEIHAAACQ